MIVVKYLCRFEYDLQFVIIQHIPQVKINIPHIIIPDTRLPNHDHQTKNQIKLEEL